MAVWERGGSQELQLAERATADLGVASLAAGWTAGLAAERPEAGSAAADWV